MKTFLVLIGSLFFVACTPSSLIVVDTNLTLTRNNEVKILGTNVGKSEYDRYFHIEVQKAQVLYQNEELFFERILVEDTWEFSRGPKEILEDIFDASRAKVLYEESTFSFVQVQLRNGKYVNLFMQSDSVNELSYVYGFSNKAMVQLMKNLQIPQSFQERDLEENTLLLSHKEKPLTTWSVSMVFLKSLVTPTYKIF